MTTIATNGNRFNYGKLFSLIITRISDDAVADRMMMATLKITANFISC